MALWDRLRDWRRPSRAAFARQLMRRLRAAGITDARLDVERFAIAYTPLGHAGTSWLFLDADYLAWLADPAGREDRLDAQVAAFVQPPEAGAEEWARIRPLLRLVLRGVTPPRLGRHRNAPPRSASPSTAPRPGQLSSGSARSEAASSEVESSEVESSGSAGSGVESTGVESSGPAGIGRHAGPAGAVPPIVGPRRGGSSRRGSRAHLPGSNPASPNTPGPNPPSSNPPSSNTPGSNTPRLSPPGAGPRGAGAPAGARLLARSFLPYLAEIVVIDQAASTEYPTTDQVAGWGVPVDEVFTAARQNLAARIRPHSPGPGPTTSIVRLPDDGSGYLASQLFVDGWLATCADRVGGRPVAFVPDGAGLLILADQPAALAELFPEVEKTYRETPGSISPMAYVSDDNGRTVPYDAPPGHPLHHLVRRAERILAVTEYGHQSGAFGGQLGGTDLVEPALFVRPDGSCFTLADWPASGHGLLPAVDIVRFGSGASQLTVAWAVVIELGLLERLPGVAPGRYRAAGHPVGEVLAALHAEAVEV